MGAHMCTRAFPLITGAILAATLAAAPAAATVEFKLQGSQTIASPGDMITFEFWVEHTDHSAAGGDLDFLIRGVSESQSVDPGQGRENFWGQIQNSITNVPEVFATDDPRVLNTGYAMDAGYDEWDFVISGERPTQDSIDWLTMWSGPPAFGIPTWRSYGLNGAIYTFDVVYEGGTLEVGIHTDGIFDMHPSMSSAGSEPRDVINAPVWTVVPAPASLGVLAMGGALALRRRRH